MKDNMSNPNKHKSNMGNMEFLDFFNEIKQGEMFYFVSTTTEELITLYKPDKKYDNIVSSFSNKKKKMTTEKQAEILAENLFPTKRKLLSKEPVMYIETFKYKRTGDPAFDHILPDMKSLIIKVLTREGVRYIVFC